MSIPRDMLRKWCYACVNHTTEIPTELSEVAKQLSKEYKHIIFCKVMNSLVVANDNMWIDKTDPVFGCKDFKRP